jgi:hypothetical protein
MASLAARWTPRMVAALVGVAALVLGIAAAGADPDDDDDDLAGDPPRADDGLTGRVLVGPDASWQVRWATAPALTAQLGASALAELAAARGGPPAPGVFGSAPPPPGWPLAVVDGRAGRSPMGGPDCDRCATRWPLAAGARVAAVWATTQFALAPTAPDDRAIRVLELRVRYRDGLAIWLNGVPVARRELAVDGDPLAIAGRPHGPEWEQIYVPVAPGLLRAGPNVLAVEARPAGHGAAPAIELTLAGRASGRVVRGPMLQAVGPDHATVVVETDVPTAATVAWGDALDRQVTSPTPTRHHRLVLTDLPRESAVAYRVAIDGRPLPVGRLATAPGPGAVVRLGLYGDVRGGHRIHAQLVERLLAEAPDAVLASGDLVLRGTDEADWQQFFAVTAPLLAAIPFYPALGNHDLGRAGALGRRFSDHFALPPNPRDRPPGTGWYSFALGDVHVVMLDSNAYRDPRQRTWLEADLSAASAARAIVVVTHHGPYSRGTHGGHADAVRDYVPILVRHRVTLIVSGHDHIYQRGEQDGLAYLVTGGGGAPLYRARCGVPGRPRCTEPDGLEHYARAHHYAVFTIYPTHAELCSKDVDGAPLEPCVRYPLRRR